MVHPAFAKEQMTEVPPPETMWNTYGYKRAMPEQEEVRPPNSLTQYIQGDELPVPRQAEAPPQEAPLDDNRLGLSTEATQYKQLLDWWEKQRSRQNYWQPGEMF